MNIIQQEIYFLKDMSLSAELFLSCSVLQLTFYALSTTYQRKYKFVILGSQMYSLAVLILSLTVLLLLNEDLLIYNYLNSNGFLINDYLGFVTKIVICIFSALFFMLIQVSYKNEPIYNNFEYVILVTISILGLLLLTCSNDLMTAYLSIELQSVAFYLMAAFKKDSSYSVESGLKYFIIGSLSSAFFLFGSCIIYGCLGSVNFDDFKMFIPLLVNSSILVFSSASLLLANLVAPYLDHSKFLSLDIYKEELDFIYKCLIYKDENVALSLKSWEKNYFEFDYSCLPAQSQISLFLYGKIKHFNEFTFLHFLEPHRDANTEFSILNQAPYTEYKPITRRWDFYSKYPTVTENVILSTLGLDKHLIPEECDKTFNINMHEKKPCVETLLDWENNNTYPYLLNNFEIKLDDNIFLYKTIDYNFLEKYNKNKYTIEQDIIYQYIFHINNNRFPMIMLEKNFEHNLCDVKEDYNLSLIFKNNLLENSNKISVFSILNALSENSNFNFKPELSSKNLLSLVSLGFIFIFISVFIKLAVAPFHFWSLDVYEGSPNVTSVFFLVIPKIAILVLLIRICYSSFYQIFELQKSYFFLFAILSIFVGALGGLEQRKIKTLLAYSSISHTGYLLLSFGTNTFEGMQMALYYLVIYMCASLCFWSVYLFIQKTPNLYKNKYNKELGDLVLLKESNQMLALTLAVTLFSIAGIPPIVGFLAKLGVFLIVIKSSAYLVAIVSILLSVISTFYYIRFIKILYFENTLVGKLYFSISTTKSVIISILLMLLIVLCIDPMIIYLLFHKAMLIMSC